MWRVNYDRAAAAMKPLYASLLVNTVLLVGCAQQVPAPAPVDQTVKEQQTPAQKIVRFVTRPAIGEKAQKEIGDTIINEALEESVDAIVLTEPVSFPHLNPPRQFAAGTKFLHNADTRTTRIYCKAHCLEEKNGVVSAFGEPSVVIDPSKFTVQSAVISVRQDELQKKLVYTGRSGKTIFLSYREFINDMARPAFTQDLTFDIASDRIVGFRGARIEVMNATNTSIEYRVLTGFRGSDGPNPPQKLREIRSTGGGGGINDGKYVVCKRPDGHVETLGEAECAVIGGIAL